MADAAAIVHTFKVGKHLVTTTVPHLKRGASNHATCEWKPDRPKELTETERGQWRRGLEEVLAECGNPDFKLILNGIPVDF
jgi:hypothetical protein